jgi:hypothetical protein
MLKSAVSKQPHALLRLEVERHAPVIILKVDVTASCNQLLRDDRLPLTGCDVERRAPILVLKIDVTAC